MEITGEQYRECDFPILPFGCSKPTNKVFLFIGLNLECIICFISVRIFSVSLHETHPLVYGHKTLSDLLHEYIAYHIAPRYCRLQEDVAIQGALHSCNMEFNVPRTALHGCNIFRYVGLPYSMYGIAHTWTILHSCHTPPVADKQYILHGNVSMHALMHYAKSNDDFRNFRQHFPCLTSDVVRCHQMSYQALFINRLSLSDFAKSGSDNGKELTSPNHSTP